MKQKKKAVIKKSEVRNVPKISPLFVRSFRLAKSNPGKTGLMVLFDALFIISVFASYRLANFLAQNIAVYETFSATVVFIVFSLAYYLIALLIYSFFKYLVLDSIKSVFDRNDLSFSRLGQFYSLNIVIAGVSFAVMIPSNYLLSSIKQAYAPYIFIMLAVPYLLLLYLVTNTAHSSFYNGSSLIESLKKGLSITFTKTRVYREIILVLIMFALGLWVVSFGSGYLISLLASRNYSLYINSYGFFKQSLIIAFDLVIYLAVLINRISFYSIAREEK